MNARERLREAKRVVVKVGTSTLVRTSGKPDFRRMDRLVREIADLKNEGREMVLVSSGAIAIGMDSIGLRQKPAEIPARQALAAIGQSSLMTLYKKFFADYGQTAAQVLLTKENAARHHQYANSRNALLELLSMGAVPVINENDVVAVDEIKIGDNDTLSATVATLIDADALLILSDIDGLYTANPQEDKTARWIPEVAEITPAIERMAGGAGSSFGTGGMATKIEAAKIAVNAGATFVIAPSARNDVISAVLAGEPVGTVFSAKEAHLRQRKSWLAFGKRIAGDVVVDEGCEAAMRAHGSSLLAAGIVAVEGDFAAGTTVRVLSARQQEIARGIVNYSAAQIAKIAGRQSRDFASLIEGEIRDEVIHRDNMVLMV
ncbi:glutamate 5-kinase [uncultured Selenomonas sp.]|uniref:glutamate 5-kinase n=1 Tax=uncultured Selenomonas sp. TaxID=159275 RepID=UPI0028DBA395|nr:glutamate 5-kinase [uncultured Selenomonas sp.]